MIKILVIVGDAGVGKDTAASYLSQRNDWNVICSYTNRPRREGECQFKEHIFVTTPAPNNTFAYTKYGNYEYWTSWEQFKEDTVNIYVVDEKGYLDVREKSEDVDIQITSVYLHASEEVRLKRGVSDSRMERDKTRIGVPNWFSYDYEIINNGLLDEFFESLNEIKVN